MPRPVPVVFKTPDIKNMCIVCGNISYKDDVVKYRISECERAKKFLEAAVYFQDNVYVRTCDLQNEHAVFGADIYYHKNCLRLYIKKYDDEKTPRKCKTLKKHAFSSTVSEIEPKLLQGNQISLSEYRDKANVKLNNKEVQFKNREIQVLLCNHYATNISFVQSVGNKSTLVCWNIESDVTNHQSVLELYETAYLPQILILATSFAMPLTLRNHGMKLLFQTQY